MTAKIASRTARIKSSLTSQTDRLNTVTSIFQTFSGAETIETKEFKKIGPATGLLKFAEK